MVEGTQLMMFPKRQYVRNSKSTDLGVEFPARVDPETGEIYS